MYRNILAVIDVDDTINDGQVIDTLEQKMDGDINVHTEKTAQNYQIVTIIPDGNREHAIIKRDMFWGEDYFVGLGYNRADGTWSQGLYSFSTADDAVQALIEEKYSFTKNSLIKRLLRYVEANSESAEELYHTLIGEIQMTESEIDDWGYGYCIPEEN